MTTTPVGVQQVLITAEALRQQLDAGGDVVILEVRRDITDQPVAGRIPGARAVALTADLVGPRTQDSGNLPLPSDEQVQDVVRRWGINADSVVVAYSPENPALAARAWWTLKWAGVPDVRALDGGTDQWVAAGGTLVSDVPADAAGTFVVNTGSLSTLDADGAAALARSGVLLDARGIEGYVGEPGGGHIPGALSLPAGKLVGPDGTLASDDELRALYASTGADGQVPVGAYCGGGTSATLTVLALAKIGITATLYPGSFSAWSSDSARPVATGDQPG
ncbi:MAG: sulfurtransferase [Mycobacterium sp.]